MSEREANGGGEGPSMVVMDLPVIVVEGGEPPTTTTSSRNNDEHHSNDNKTLSDSLPVSRSVSRLVQQGGFTAEPLAFRAPANGGTTSKPPAAVAAANIAAQLMMDDQGVLMTTTMTSVDLEQPIDAAEVERPIQGVAPTVQPSWRLWAVVVLTAAALAVLCWLSYYTQVNEAVERAKQSMTVRVKSEGRDIQSTLRSRSQAAIVFDGAFSAFNNITFEQFTGLAAKTIGRVSLPAGLVSVWLVPLVQHVDRASFEQQYGKTNYSHIIDEATRTRAGNRSTYAPMLYAFPNSLADYLVDAFSYPQCNSTLRYYPMKYTIVSPKDL